MNSLCLKFKNEMYNAFPKLDFGIIIYGSNILDANSSDLDVCIICDNINLLSYGTSWSIFKLFS